MLLHHRLCKRSSRSFRRKVVHEDFSNKNEAAASQVVWKKACRNSNAGCVEVVAAEATTRGIPGMQ
jgi:hypothetical protein